MRFEQPRWTDHSYKGIARFCAQVQDQYLHIDVARSFGRRFLYAGTHHKPLICETANDVIGAQMFFSAGIAMGWYDESFRRGWGEEKWEVLKAASLSALTQARPFLLRQQAALLAHSFNLPEHIVSRTVLPYEAMFFAFERNGLISLQSSVREAGEDNWGCMLVVAGNGLDLPIKSTGSELVILFLGVTQDGEHDAYAVVDSVFGRRYPQDVDRMSQILQVLNFMQSKIALVRKDRASRAARRRYPMHAIVQSDVGIVALREYEKRPDLIDPGDEAEHADIEHKWRWMVRGHYRAQWYATEEAHHLIWIAPHVKGPEDRPLRPTVYDVRR